jgi:hypothetical protein
MAAPFARQETSGKGSDVFQNKRLEKLIRVAEAGLIKRHAKSDLNELIVGKKQWQVNSRKGWGVDRKIKAFKAWYSSSGLGDNCVYVFGQGAAVATSEGHFEAKADRPSIS